MIHIKIIEVAKKALDERGFGVASAPQICGTTVSFSHFQGLSRKTL